MDSPKAARPVVAKPPVPVSALGVACVATIASVVIEELLEDRDQPWV